MMMRELAERIDAHLQRFEADPEINLDKSEHGSGRYTYYHAGASYHKGPKLHVTYISYQSPGVLSKSEAERYLEMLDAGFIGRHFEALREVH